MNPNELDTLRDRVDALAINLEVNERVAHDAARRAEGLETLLVGFTIIVLAACAYKAARNLAPLLELLDKGLPS